MPIKDELFKLRFSPKGIKKSPHYQTVYPSLFYSPPDLDSTEEITVKIDSENSLLCDYNKYYLSSKSDACVILVHGLGSDSKANYIISMARKIINCKIDTLRINLRTANNSYKLCNNLYHAGISDDLKEVVKYVINELGYKKIYIVGASLGANLVLKLAGEYKEKYPVELKSICAISPPFDLLDSAKAMQKKQNKIYHDYYYKKIYNNYLEMNKHKPEHTDLSILKKVKNLYDVDDYLIAHHFNFKNAIDYYSKVSSIYFMDKIKVDTLIIHAKDDPIIPLESYEKSLDIRNPNIKFIITDNGGHVAFINNRKLAKQDIDEYWAENRFIEYLNYLNNN